MSSTPIPDNSECAFSDITAGLPIFFKIGGPEGPMEQNMVGHFLK